MGFAAGDTNLRRYVGNTPTTFIDPSGLEKAPAFKDDPPFNWTVIKGYSDQKAVTGGTFYWKLEDNLKQQSIRAEFW